MRFKARFVVNGYDKFVNRLKLLILFLIHFLLLEITHNITSNYKEVVNTFESSEWKNAMDEEMQSLHKNQIWDLV